MYNGPFDIIVYHGNCPDGWCAAYVLWKHTSPFAALVPATHGVAPDDNDFKGKRVCVVDFSWKRDVMVRLRELATELVVLDHHQTAAAELEGLDFCVFDMTRSGAQMAWDFSQGEHSGYGTIRPWFVDYVADRDLWQWKLPNSQAVNALIMATPQTKEAWDAMTDGGNEVPDAVVIAGAGARLHVEHYVEKVVAQAIDGGWEGHSVLVVNAPYPNCSDVGHALCLKGADIGLVWFVRGDSLMQFSLRSRSDLDVSVLAKAHGGGGHKNAAGFELLLMEGLGLLAKIVRGAEGTDVIREGGD